MDLEKENEALKNLVEKQRKMIKDIANKHNELFKELEMLKNEHKTEYLIGIFTNDISDYFHIGLSEKELETIKRFGNMVNNETNARINIYLKFRDE